ncbi:leucine rich repeat domain-containing protein [Phthorimaea operculella]|nr:leucine rich repeat domain-containing protein [Phthorimaea operculella]
MKTRAFLFPVHPKDKEMRWGFKCSLWVFLVFYANIRASIINEFSEMSSTAPFPKEDAMVRLPIDVGIDSSSGCLCRATKNRYTVVCFGNYDCRKFPKFMIESEELKVRTTVMERIGKDDLIRFKFLTSLEIEANHKLTYIEPGTFRNLTKLQHLSISYNTALNSIDENIFQGLINLRNLTLINNGFTNLLHLTNACRPTILPSLRQIDLSENLFREITEHVFLPMQGTLLQKLDVSLGSIDYIHPKSFLPLKNLKELVISDNELNGSLIGNFLLTMQEEGIHLTHLDLSGLGFRKQPPRELLHIIAQTSIRKLNLCRNQFEIIYDDTFPIMNNIELIDLRKVQAVNIFPYAFDPLKFPNLKVLLLGGNNLPGIHPYSTKKPIVKQEDRKSLDTGCKGRCTENFGVIRTRSRTTA